MLTLAVSYHNQMMMMMMIAYCCDAQDRDQRLISVSWIKTKTSTPCGNNRAIWDNHRPTSSKCKVSLVHVTVMELRHFFLSQRHGQDRSRHETSRDISDLVETRRDWDIVKMFETWDCETLRETQVSINTWDKPKQFNITSTHLHKAHITVHFTSITSIILTTNFTKL